MFSKSREAPLSDSKIKLLIILKLHTIWNQNKTSADMILINIFLRFDTRQDRGKDHSRKCKKSTVTEY